MISTAWATASLVRARRLGVLMPALVAVFMHVVQGGWLLLWTTSAALELLLRDQSRCYSWTPVDPIEDHECNEWAAKFEIFLWVFVGIVFVLGYVAFFFLAMVLG
jgi:hypothetical protein